ELGMASLDEIPADQTSLLGDTVAAIMQEAKEQVENVIEALPMPEEPLNTAAASTAPSPNISQNTAPEPEQSKTAKTDPVQDPAAPLCFNCGNQTQRAGTCYVCTSCGSTTGCS